VIDDLTALRHECVASGEWCIRCGERDTGLLCEARVRAECDALRAMLRRARTDLLPFHRTAAEPAVEQIRRDTANAIAVLLGGEQRLDKRDLAPDDVDAQGAVVLDDGSLVGRDAHDGGSQRALLE